MAAHKTTHHRATAVNSGQRNKVMLVLIIIALVIVGYFVFRSQAGQPAVALTASKGTVASPAVTLTDSTATGGSAVQFKAGSTGGGKRCGNPPTGNKIDTVVVISEENKTWSSVRDKGQTTGFSPGSMPYMNTLSQECFYFQNDTEVDTGENSATQYAGAWTGFGPSVTHVAGDCAPSASCSWTVNNIFRSFRNAGIQRIDYVDGGSTPCKAGNNSPEKHIPELYAFDPTDKANCANEVRPLSEFNWANPRVGYSFISTDLCHDGHDSCGGSSIAHEDQYVASVLPALFNSAQYKAGKVLVDIWWDEDHPRPNLFACWSCKQGVSTIDPHFSGESALWLNLLGASTANLGPISTATDLRPILGTP